MIYYIIAAISFSIYTYIDIVHYVYLLAKENDIDISEFPMEQRPISYPLVSVLVFTVIFPLILCRIFVNTNSFRQAFADKFTNN